VAATILHNQYAFIAEVQVAQSSPVRLLASLPYQTNDALNLVAVAESISLIVARIMVRVFLSHPSKDKPFVRDLADILEAGGEIKVGLDH
jgi:hypothetical protein